MYGDYELAKDLTCPVCKKRKKEFWFRKLGTNVVYRHGTCRKCRIEREQQRQAEREQAQMVENRKED